ncbi:hypothetical protein D5086_021570 [Populus alba]|uniref:Uncharacterized protein n=1 Tax=Populus alba TaxID=43335 RepID=A0ACC4BD55_POPAL
MLRTVIGDGRSANAWSDSWVPDLPNSRISSSRSPILQGGVGISSEVEGYCSQSGNLKYLQKCGIMLGELPEILEPCNMPEKRDCHLSSELGDTPTKELERASLQASWDAKLVIFIFFPFLPCLSVMSLMTPLHMASLQISSTSKSKVLQPTVSIISLVNGRLAYPLWCHRLWAGPATRHHYQNHQLQEDSTLQASLKTSDFNGCLCAHRTILYCA